MLAANVIGTPVCSWEPGVRGSAAFSAFSLLTFLLDTVSAFDRSVIFKFREVRGRVGFSFPGASSLSYGATPWWRKKYWEIIADNLSKAGWSWGCVSAVDSNGRTNRTKVLYVD